jgi:outer membrane protein TolC
MSHAIATRLGAAAASVAVLLGGCASVPSDGGFDRVAAAAQQRLGAQLLRPKTDADARQIERRVAALLGQPLSADAAVQLALLNNPGLQARLYDLDIAQAELVQAGRLPNPGISLGRLRQGGEVEIERGLHLNLASLLVRPLALRLEARRFDRAQAEVAMDVLALAADTRKAHVRAVAAEESLRYARQVAEVAEAGAELAQRMEAAGNFNRLARAREQAFHADAMLGLARAEQVQRATRERLARLLGLQAAQVVALSLPERLPDLPAAPPAPIEPPGREQQAVAERLDVLAARAHAGQTAHDLGLTRSTRWVNVLELGRIHNSASDAPRQTGWSISLELPLFDSGDARVARAEAVYRQALHHAARVAIDARSELREAQANARAAHDIARHHRDELVPLAQRISEEQLLRYNGMLIGVFELLADARAQIASVNAAIDALRDFWLAQAELEMALVGKATLTPPAASAAAAPMGTAPH